MKRLPLLFLLSAILTAVSVYGRSTKTYHDGLIGLQSDTIVELIPASDADLFRALEVRGSIPKSGVITLFWGKTAENSFNFATIANDTHGFDDLIDKPGMIITTGTVKNGVESENERFRIEKDIETNGGENSYAVEISRTTVKLLAGHKTLTEIATLPSGQDDLHGAVAIGFDSSPKISLVVTEQECDLQKHITTGHTRQSLEKYFAAENHTLPEGIWKYLDRDTDPQYARPGGFYELAIVKSEDGSGFDIIYLEGSQTMSSAWKPGMKKGHLTPTAFSDHYDLQWIDSTMHILDTECSASIESGSILRLDFPLLKSSMRFSVRHQDK